METKLIEIQIRTILQHEWAELSERFSDKIDPSIKYGGGNRTIQESLLGLSRHYKDYEKLEAEIFETSPEIKGLDQDTLNEWRHKMSKLKGEMIELAKIKFEG